MNDSIKSFLKFVLKLPKCLVVCMEGVSAKVIKMKESNLR